jgi:benzoyl-CoA reductase/2-hydroxyglutaryl-CoA dehydratase subunit BcrC/BadD/HgdB
MQSYALMKDLLGRYYSRAKTARLREEKVAWITSGAPVELLYASDVIPLYPEQHAAACATAGISESLCQEAEKRGYSIDTCSYVRTDLGSLESGESPVGGMPLPDFLVAANNICSTVIKWYEILERRFGVPLFIADLPFIHGDIDDDSLQYVIAQFRSLEDMIGRMTGKRMDTNRMQQTFAHAIKASMLWKEVLGKATEKPSPITAFDTFILMAPIVVLRGTVEAVDFYEKVNNELEGLVLQGHEAVPGEKIRLLWDNLPVWHRMKGLSTWFRDRKVSIVAATYTSSWTLLTENSTGGAAQELTARDGSAEFPEREVPVDRSGEVDPVEALARAYLSPYINRGFAFRLSELRRLVDVFHCDGIIFHSNRSCKPYSLGQPLLKKLLAREGIPSLLIESDMNDPRVFTEGNVLTQIEAFLERFDGKS